MNTFETGMLTLAVIFSAKAWWAAEEARRLAREAAKAAIATNETVNPPMPMP